MSISLKQDVIQASRKGNCPFHQKDSHACWGCPYSITIDNASGIGGYLCNNEKYDKKVSKVKVRKVKRERNKIK